MATQYTAGLTTGQVLTAATMNSIGAAWETWTPTFTPSSGTFTTITTSYARYGRIQNVVFGSVDMTITNIGTGTGVLVFTLPVTAKYTFQPCGVFRELAVNGYTGIVTTNDTTSNGSLRQYDNANYLAANKRFVFTFTYEAA
jgi:hypothetical protein